MTIQSVSPLSLFSPEIRSPGSPINKTCMYWSTFHGSALVHRRRRAPEHTHTEKDRNCELLWQLAKSASPKSAEVIRSPDRDFRGIQVPRDTLTRTDVSEVREEEEEGERWRSEEEGVLR